MSQPPSAPQLSPDGRFYWDGTKWVPVATPTPAPKASGGGWARTIVVGIVCLIVGSICGTALANSSRSTPTTSTSTSTPTNGTAATAVPVKSTPTPRQVVTLNGQGSKVLPITLSTGSYRVDWTAQGNDNFILHIHLGSQDQSLVNEIPPNPAAGQTLFDAPQDDSYTLEVKASTLAWTVTFTPI